MKRCADESTVVAAILWDWKGREVVVAAVVANFVVVVAAVEGTGLDTVVVDLANFVVGIAAVVVEDTVVDFVVVVGIASFVGDFVADIVLAAAVVVVVGTYFAVAFDWLGTFEAFGPFVAFDWLGTFGAFGWPGTFGEAFGWLGTFEAFVPLGTFGAFD